MGLVCYRFPCFGGIEQSHLPPDILEHGPEVFLSAIVILSYFSVIKYWKSPKCGCIGIYLD